MSASMPPEGGDVTKIVRGESAKVVASLVRLTGDVATAEELFQEAVLSALEVWPQRGVPDRPGAWMLTVARNRYLDAVRRDARHARKRERLRAVDRSHPSPDEADTFGDHRLELFFTCCHPVLARESQVALTLRLVAGLATAEIARAFLQSEATIAQRLVRAKRMIKAKALPYAVPEAAELPERLESVLAVIYFVFNEGHTASSGQELQRVDLAAQAVQLGSALVELLPDEPEARGLLALMLLHASRAMARVDAAGELVLLEDQDRTRWNAELIARGLDELQRAEAAGRPGAYQLQAHIAACHAVAPRFESTDWERIVALYEALELLAPSPVITLNKAVAIGMSQGPAAGLAVLDGEDAVTGLDAYHLLPATRADLLRRLGRTDDARREYVRAHALAQNERERNYLARRLADL